MLGREFVWHVVKVDKACGLKKTETGGIKRRRTTGRGCGNKHVDRVISSRMLGKSQTWKCILTCRFSPRDNFGRDTSSFILYTVEALWCSMLLLRRPMFFQKNGYLLLRCVFYGHHIFKCDNTRSFFKIQSNSIWMLGIKTKRLIYKRL